MFTGIFFSEKFLHIDGGMSAYPQRSQISRPCDHQISPFLEFSGKNVFFPNAINVDAV